MKKEVFDFLKKYSPDPILVDRLIISTFIYSHKLESTKNKLLKSYCIKVGQEDYKGLQDFLKICKFDNLEDLIEVFEFIVSPEDKIVTGAVYTPVYIRNYIVDECLLNRVDWSTTKICDPACGCAGFLYTAALKIKNKTGKPFYKVFLENIFGLDIQGYSVTRSKLLLTLLAVKKGEDSPDFKFNLYKGNALDFKWENHISKFKGFEIVVGNPPYVCSRNMDDENFKLLDKWSVTKTGHPDLYIPFFQIGYENLADKGILGLITVNTFIKSINGRALRTYFADNKVDLQIINFGGEQIFKDKNTYTCICFLRKRHGGVNYKRIFSSALLDLDSASYFKYSYDNLNNQDGWNLVDSADKNRYIGQIESTGKPFKDLYVTRNGIATLRNDIYKFKPDSEDDHYFYITKFGKEYPIEKKICRKIVNANKIKTDRDLTKKIEWIIFPYTQENGEILILRESHFREFYPYAYRYLTSLKIELSLRDKGKTSKYEKWYAYGRRQSMDIHSYKLFFPHICERPTFVISRDRDLLFYNGLAVISNNLRTLQELKSLLESDIFFEYIRNTTKDYSSGYISMSRNYIKNFGVLSLSDEDRLVLNHANTDQNEFWANTYHKAFKILQDKSSAG